LHHFLTWFKGSSFFVFFVEECFVFFAEMACSHLDLKAAKEACRVVDAFEGASP
jgi:hypothetical protein